MLPIRWTRLLVHGMLNDSPNPSTKKHGISLNALNQKAGAMAAIEEGWQQQEIHLSAYQYLTEIEQNKRNIVGVNHGVMEELGEIPVMKTDATLGERQTERLKTLKATRNNDDVARSLRGPGGGGCGRQPVSPRD